MKTRCGAVICASACSLGLLATCAALPIWTGTTRENVNGVAGPTTMIRYQGGPIWKSDLVDETPFRQRNWIQGAILAGVAIGLGLLVFRAASPRQRPDSAGDYEEGLDGSIQDGRDPPPEAGPGAKPNDPTG